MSRHSSSSAPASSSSHRSQVSSRRRSVSRFFPARDVRASSARPALDFFWSLGFLDRLQPAPLTHYHE